ncbi:chromosome partitioning protein ParB [Oleiharenicola lentus]|uniref:Chromosome partitioning protein ParB n=1 Tax=Oleiharenicola lentus TaxID=2508720 RepID=A0A4Q1C8E8_9BACT|nr:ParB N-terminal domain-containing protein [Oleiharenicola lentus]RXK55223.1 chromosome partitioning protein ParB [Oleiharenicola lentus]
MPAKPALKRLPPKKRPRKAKAGSRGADAAAALLPGLTGMAADTKATVEAAGGVVVGQYLDPIGQSPLLVAVLPVAKVEPTPFQRDVSDLHHKKLADVIDRTGIFLDPIIAITAPGGGFWTPNGGHRLAAMKRLGAKAITALVVPKREIAWQILALNTEKAHNLKDKSLEVIRIFRNLLEERAAAAEKEFAYYFEEASLITMGLCYEQHPRFSGGVYNSFVRRLSQFSDESLTKSLKEHERIAALLLELDAAVAAVVAKLKAKGFVSPYLKSFVVARSNPLRFMKEPPALEELIRTIRGKVDRFNVDRIKPEDITASGGGAPDEE